MKVLRAATVAAAKLLLEGGVNCFPPSGLAAASDGVGLGAVRDEAADIDARSLAPAPFSPEIEVGFRQSPPDGRLGMPVDAVGMVDVWFSGRWTIFQ